MKYVTNIQNIVHTTEKSVLIKIEKSEFKFWLPKKFVRDIGHWEVSVFVPDSFKLKIFRNGKGRYNFKDVIEEKDIDCDELPEYYPENKNFES